MIDYSLYGAIPVAYRGKPAQASLDSFTLCLKMTDGSFTERLYQDVLHSLDDAAVAVLASWKELWV